MNTTQLLAALDLPSSSRISQRIPKKLLLEHGAPTAGDKRAIGDGVEELLWVAALKSNTVCVPEFRDETREYVEIAILQLALRSDAKVYRLMELVQRLIPYPLLLLVELDTKNYVSAVHKRWSQNSAADTVLDGEVTTLEWDTAGEDAIIKAFAASMSIGNQPRTTLYALYHGWLDSLDAAQAARYTGRFSKSNSAIESADRRTALREYERLDADIARLRATALKETQLAKQVELNLELKRAGALHTAALARL